MNNKPTHKEHAEYMVNNFLGRDEMGNEYTYEQIANDFRLWGEYVDANAEMTEAEFDNLSIEEKVALQVEAFGPQA